MEIKYEAVFGPQELFDGAPEDAEYAGWFCQEIRWYMILNGKILFSDGGTWCTSDNPYLSADIAAMRRIIKDPKYWTWEDKKAGRLPEVGAKYISDDTEFTCHYIDNSGDVWGHTKNDAVRCRSIGEIIPIESPEERANRVREEWCSSANMLISKDKDDRAESAVIYDALLSGELKMPEVQN